MRLAWYAPIAAAAGLVALLLMPQADAVWQDDRVHIALVGVANIISATIAVIALISFTRSGQMRELGIAVAFLGFVALYLWHGLYTGSPAPFQWLIYGPTARVAFAAALLTMLLPWEIKRPKALLIAGAVMFVGMTFFLLAGAAGPALGRWALEQDPQTIQTVRITIELAAAALASAALALFWFKPWANTWLRVGVSLILMQSIYFLFAAAWNVTWWAAHALGAVSTATVAASVLVVARTTEQAMERAHVLREAAVRREFVNNASHAIRTPLTTIRLSTRQLAQEDPEKRAKAVASIERATKSLQDIATQLEQFAHEGLQMQHATTIVHLEPVIRATIGDRDVAFKGTTARVAVDEEHVGKILTALLDNAFRHGKGRVRVGTQTQTQWVDVIISDEGEGISDARRELIFLPFGDFDHERGSGFTLEWCRRSAEAMGGSLEMDANGPGTSFRLRLPRRRRPIPQA